MSIAARPIAKEPIFMVRNAAALGVRLGLTDAPAEIESTRPGSPADKGGLKEGDIIEAVAGKPAKNCGEVRKMLGKYSPGDKVKFAVKRGKKKLELTVELGSAARLSAPPGEMGSHNLDALSSKGGTISKRKNNFPLALTHDGIIQAAQCGGPIVDLDGHVIGLDIAREDRTATLAIPAAKAKSMIEAMLPK